MNMAVPCLLVGIKKEDPINARSQQSATTTAPAAAHAGEMGFRLMEAVGTLGIGNPLVVPLGSPAAAPTLAALYDRVLQVHSRTSRLDRTSKWNTEEIKIGYDNMASN
jgi:hypothetical protein